MLGSRTVNIQNGSRNNKACGNRLQSISASANQIGDFTIKDVHSDDHRMVAKDREFLGDIQKMQGIAMVLTIVVMIVAILICVWMGALHL